jgi:hypothetical protein
MSVEEFEAKSDAFLRTAQHPTLGRGYLETAYLPLVDLLGYLAANGFTNYIASGGGREFDYTSGAEQALERAGQSGWTVVSMKTNWATIF